MGTTTQAGTVATIGRGVLAGLAGTVVMTAFQKAVEMPLTHRETSYAPADFAERILPVHPSTPQDRDRLNWAAHFALGAMWGTAYGVAATAGLRGPRAVAAVFATVYTSELALNTALGLYHPTRWTGQEWAVDLVDKYVQALATGQVFDRLLDPARSA